MIEGAPTCGDAGGRRADGEPCQVQTGLSEINGRCLHHDPDRGEERQAFHSAGGRRSAEIVKAAKRRRETTAPANMPSFDPDTLEKLAAWHKWVARAVATGEIGARTAGEITRTLKELRPALLQIDLEKQVKELERELKKALANRS